MAIVFKNYTLYDGEGVIHGTISHDTSATAMSYANNINLSALVGDFDKFYYSVDVRKQIAIRNVDFNLSAINLRIPADNSEHVILENIPSETLIKLNHMPLGKTTETDNLILSFSERDAGIYRLNLYNNNYTLSSGTFLLTAYEN